MQILNPTLEHILQLQVTVVNGFETVHQASDDHFKLPPAPLLASCIKDPLIECNVTGDSSRADDDMHELCLHTG